MSESEMLLCFQQPSPQSYPSKPFPNVTLHMHSHEARVV